MKPFVLIVDDEAQIREIIASVLEDSGVNCLMAENGLKALELIQKHPGKIGTVVSDISMPSMTGLQFIAKAREQGFDMPVIFITGFGDKQTMAEALRLGAYDFIDKPFDLDKLEKNILKALDAGMELNRLYEEIEKATPNDPKSKI